MFRFLSNRLFAPNLKFLLDYIRYNYLLIGSLCAPIAIVFAKILYTYDIYIILHYIIFHINCSVYILWAYAIKTKYECVIRDVPYNTTCDIKTHRYRNGMYFVFHIKPKFGNYLAMRILCSIFVSYVCVCIIYANCLRSI